MTPKSSVLKVNIKGDHPFWGALVSFCCTHKQVYFGTTSLHNLEEKRSSTITIVRLDGGAFQSWSTTCLGHKSLVSTL